MHLPKTNVAFWQAYEANKHLGYEFEELFCNEINGVISVAVIKHEFKSEKFWRVLQDSLNLVIFAIVLLFFSALIEVFVTPAIF